MPVSDLGITRAACLPIQPRGDDATEYISLGIRSLVPLADNRLMM